MAAPDQLDLRHNVVGDSRAALAILGLVIGTVLVFLFNRVLLGPVMRPRAAFGT